MFFWDEDAKRIKDIKDSLNDVHSRLNTVHKQHYEETKHLKDLVILNSAKIDELKKVVGEMTELQEMMANTLSSCQSFVEYIESIKGKKVVAKPEKKKAVVKKPKV